MANEFFILFAIESIGCYLFLLNRQFNAIEPTCNVFAEANRTLQRWCYYGFRFFDE